MTGRSSSPSARSHAAVAIKRQLGVADYVAGVRSGDRMVLARAITLVESRSHAHRALARDVLERLLPDTGAALRVGITGPPGVGKSTLIDTLGTRLTARGRRVAVLAVDPSSDRTGGSLLGDKTRMNRLATDPHAFIRPSPTAGTLGGVARKTRESILLCEAAGYDVVLVETVGVGQSETHVSSMVDCFVVLLLAGAGDELQGIKKGVVELADVLAITKADGPNKSRAEQAREEYRRALHFLAAPASGWKVPVLAVSAASGDGIDALWDTIQAHREHDRASGEFGARRSRQARAWLHTLVDEALRERFFGDPDVIEQLPKLEAQVVAGHLAPESAVKRLMGDLEVGTAVEPKRQSSRAGSATRPRRAKIRAATPTKR